MAESFPKQRTELDEKLAALRQRVGGRAEYHRASKLQQASPSCRLVGLGTLEPIAEVPASCQWLAPHRVHDGPFDEEYPFDQAAQEEAERLAGILARLPRAKNRGMDAMCPQVLRDAPYESRLHVAYILVAVKQACTPMHQMFMVLVSQASFVFAT